METTQSTQSRTVTLSREAFDYLRSLVGVDNGENVPSDAVAREVDDALNWG